MREFGRYLRWWVVENRRLTLVASGPLMIVIGVWGAIASTFDNEGDHWLPFKFVGLGLFGCLIVFGDLFTERKRRPWNVRQLKGDGESTDPR